ncbi:MAG: isoprenyl transferase [Pseudomonadota bacterium]
MLQVAPEPSLTMPEHVAIIMDGNGRWASSRGLPRILGHRKGAAAVKRAVKAAVELDIPYLTLFGFSTENWRRPVEEVDELMRLMRHYLRSEVAELHKNGVCLKVIGDRDRLPRDIIDLIDHAETIVPDPVVLTLTVALSYGGRGDILQAVRSIAEAARDGVLDPSTLDEGVVGGFLQTNGLPDPDLLIRTSGEQRISNFLLWQSAYAELIFTDTLWPDFDRDDLEAAVVEFGRRERRFGAVEASA